MKKSTLLAIIAMVPLPAKAEEASKGMNSRTENISNEDKYLVLLGTDNANTFGMAAEVYYPPFLGFVRPGFSLGLTGVSHE